MAARGRKRVLEGDGSAQRVRLGGREASGCARLRLACAPEQVHHERAFSGSSAAGSRAAPRCRGCFLPGSNWS